ncbi:MAG: hypothetical protein GXP14_07410 [Gammaproteobacteria bacterium]|nr:hypothetical protein [Gammaproteobacteria bacterium]
MGQKSLLRLDDDAINSHMVQGIMSGIKKELKSVLMDTAEKEIDLVVEKVSKRLEVHISKGNFGLENSHISLRYLLEKEK